VGGVVVGGAVVVKAKVWGWALEGGTDLRWENDGCSTSPASLIQGRKGKQIVPPSNHQLM
jgi:hypothetical protein